MLMLKSTHIYTGPLKNKLIVGYQHLLTEPFCQCLMLIKVNKMILK